MICLKHVSFSFVSGGMTTPVLDDVSLTINKGESVAIVGPSGSGKSTLLHLIACFLKPKSGTISIEGVDASTLDDLGRAVVRNEKIGFVFQQFHLLPRASVIENILLPTKYPCELRSDDKEVVKKAEKLAQQFGLDGQFHKKPNQLSGGQQQRVAIARALINDAEIILADEPTGNLDSKNAAHVVELLKALNDQGKTIVVITHDMNIAQQFNKIYEIHDGKITRQHVQRPSKKLDATVAPKRLRKRSSALVSMLPLAFENMRRHSVRSWLTMLGIAIGVAAVLATSTLGSFVKEKMLASYAELGVNTINFSGYPSFTLTATDDVPALFRSFDDERDLKPLKRIFPNIKRIAPQTNPAWGNTVTYGGKSVGPNVVAAGVGHQTFAIMNWPLKSGASFSKHHIDQSSAVCVVGSDVERDLFRRQSPLGKMIHISDSQRSYVCKIVGVLTERSTNKPWDQTPNLKVFLPYTFMQATQQYWARGVNGVLIEIEEDSGITKTGDGIKNFFVKKYGKSGEFFVGFDATLLEQMNKFLNIFALVLTVIALICLGVGGIGIANMMLVSLSERFKEIGLRKAVGATNASIRVQFLTESLVLCMLAGLIGLFFGIVGYEAAIYAASILVKNLPFQWVFDGAAMILAFASIVVVGFLSGLTPAIKAEKLEIAEALRAE